MRLVAVILLLVAASPGAFWLTYGTFDPCAAAARRVVQVKAEPGADLAFGVAVVRGMLDPLAPRDCLALLWRLETERPR